MNQTAIVTGACGYIGRHVVNALLARGVKVIAVDVVERELPNDCTLMVGDLLHDADFVARLPVVDVVIHLAWQDGFKHNSFSHMANLNSHLGFLNAMADKGVKRLTVMGSMHEVGYWEGAITADTPCNPLSMYGIAKNALRQALTVALKGTDTKLQWLRGYYIYGDDKSNHSVFTKLLESAADGKKEFPFTSGKNLYDFVSVDQLARMIAVVATQDEIVGIINCCTGKPKSLAQAVEEFISANHLNIKLAYGAYPDRPYDSPGVWGDASIIENILKDDNNG